MRQENATVEIVGLEGLTVNESAKSIVEKAGYQVRVTELKSSDLLYIWGTYGASRLPFARQGERMYQGMREIRNQFSVR